MQQGYQAISTKNRKRLPGSRWKENIHGGTHSPFATGREKVNWGSDVGDGPTGTAVEWSSRTRSGEDIGQHDPGEETVAVDWGSGMEGRVAQGGGGRGGGDD
jgi:hypothetical protein